MGKLEYLNKKIFAPFNAKLLHLPKGKKEYQAFVERSPQSDDQEFYIPKIERSLELKEFYFNRTSSLGSGYDAFQEVEDGTETFKVDGLVSSDPAGKTY